MNPWEKYAAQPGADQTPAASQKPWERYAAPDAAQTSPATPAPAAPPEEERLAKRVMGGAMEPMLSMGTGAAASAAGGLAGLGAMPFVGMDKAADIMRSIQQAGTYQPHTQGGKDAMSVIGYPFRKIGQAANWAGDKTLDKTGSPAAAAAVDTAAQVLPQVLLGAAGRSAMRPTPPKALTQAQSTAQASIDAGYVLPPSAAKPGVLNGILEGLGGKINTRQTASAKNQVVTDAKVREALGLAPDAPINPDTLGQVRAQAGRAYAAVKGVTGAIRPDFTFTNQVMRLGGDFTKAANRLPSSFNVEPIRQMQGDLVKGNYTPTQLVEVVKGLRAQAKLAMRSDDPQTYAMGQAQRGAADALDGLLERQLKAAGLGGLARDLRSARMRIAQSYDVETAMNPGTGEVDARVLARIAKKGPMGGGLAPIAKFGAGYPLAAQPTAMTGGVPHVSPLDMGAALMAPNSEGLLMLGRAPIRSLVTSGPYQRAMVRPGNPQTNLGPLLGLLQSGAIQPPQGGQQ